MVLDAVHRIVVDGASLTREEAYAVMAQILSGGATDAQSAALLAALHMKGETIEEIVGFAEAFRAVTIPVPFYEGSAASVDQPAHKVLVDTCGTGGDASGTFNISATALVVAGAGVRVAKHGNRSITSKCGSADVMEALGMNITLRVARGYLYRRKYATELRRCYGTGFNAASDQDVGHFIIKSRPSESSLLICIRFHKGRSGKLSVQFLVGGQMR